MQGQNKKFIRLLNNAFALLGANEELLTIINNDKQSMSETIKQLDSWCYYKSEEIQHDLYGEDGILQSSRKKANDIESDLLDRMKRFGSGEKIQVIVVG